jgi:leader peptidase (prepilin peptidase)/N-methyltransferase
MTETIMTNTPPPFDAMWFKLLLGIIIGLALGSFTTMLSYRLPRKLSIVTPGSHCPSCKAPLKPRDLVPVFSWLVMKGKCRYCGVQIGARYVWIELVTAAASALAFGTIGFQPALFAALVGIVAIITVATIGLEKN